MRRWALPLGAAALQLIAVRAGEPAEPPDLLAGPVGLVLGLVAVLVQGGSLLWRRTRPVPVLAVCTAAYAVNAAIVPGVPPYAGWFALYAAGVYTQPGRRAISIVTAGVVALAGIVLLVAVVYPAPGAALVLIVLITVIVALVATLVRFQRAQQEALRHRAVAEERLRIARDLHDLVGHGLSSIAVQSSTARMALDAGRLDATRTALAAVEASSRSALQEMRQLLGVLRPDGGGDYRPPPGLGDLPELVDRLRAQGVPVTLTAGDVGKVPGAAALAAYRIVQEALTNAVKHAPGSRVTVDVTAADDAVLVVVEDFAEQSRPPAHQQAGHGLTGMRERVAIFGGELSAGPAGDHLGWRVRARIPYRDEGPR